ncbi:MAG TPA: sugar phosphate nucleotidyltransferase [Saprospiraceae bacterium]|nr:sugar phosphate nucleotidyltransferase [Saprospiraceae bacterium]
MSFTACVLVGGKGSRLGTTSLFLPKCLTPIYGVPFLELLVKKLIFEGCSKVILITGYLSFIVEDFVSERLSSYNISTSSEEGGTGKALFKALTLADKHDEILCLNGDTILDIQYEQVINYHRESNTQVTIVTTELLGVPNEGAIQISTNSEIVLFNENDNPSNDSNCCYKKASNCGCYCFNNQYLKNFIEKYDGSSLEKDILPKLVSETKSLSFNNGIKAFWDFGTPDRLNLLPEKFSQTEIDRIYHKKLL